MPPESLFPTVLRGTVWSRIGPNTDSDDRIGSKRLKENR